MNPGADYILIMLITSGCGTWRNKINNRWIFLLLAFRGDYALTMFTRNIYTKKAKMNDKYIRIISCKYYTLNALKSVYIVRVKV